MPETALAPTPSKVSSKESEKTGDSNKTFPSVNVTCVTYRNPENDSFIRTAGIMCLIDQMRRQDYDGNITISLIDDSPEPHHFAEEVARRAPDQVSYVHAQTRDELRAELLEICPDYAKLVPTDQILQKACLRLLKINRDAGRTISPAEFKLSQGDFDLSEEEWNTLINRAEYKAPCITSTDLFLANHYDPIMDLIEGDAEVQFWAERIGQMRGYGATIPFEEDYPVQTNIVSQIFQQRPTIGMKKNAGNAIADAKFNKPEILVYADDDDHHAPDYVQKSVDALGDADFTRMTRYITYIYEDEPEKAQVGIFDLPVEKDMNGYWALSYPDQQSPRHMWMAKDAKFETMPIGQKFNRQAVLAWPILAHEGALHTFKFNTWRDSVETVGGAAPVSFCEDIIYYRMLKDHYGAQFSDAHTKIEPGEESFIRIADGNNASFIEVSLHIDMSDTPAWAQKAVNTLHGMSNEENFFDRAFQQRIAANVVSTTVEYSSAFDALFAAGNDDEANDDQKLTP